MSIPEALQQLRPSLQTWRRHLHQFPETAFSEWQTADYVAGILESLDLEVHRGLGKTGIVACLSAGSSRKSIALRADMDALPIQELTGLPYQSVHPGKMHACGHDGHTAMLLGAACYLSQHRHFDGTVYFIFQPAEEGQAGAKAMIDDGLFERFPADSVYGLHNFPNIPQGHFAVKTGAMMASSDSFEIRLNGRGTHAALPHLGDDVIVVAAHIINTLQSLVSRQLDANEAVVVSVTQIHSGEAWNVLPETAVLRGTVRCFNPAVRLGVQDKIRQITDGICQANGISAEVEFNPLSPGYPVTMNSPEETAIVRDVVERLVGKDQVCEPMPSMGAEDFAFMLQQKPGCYAWIGNGPGDGGCLLHNPRYDFNDDNLVLGATYWVRLVERVLASSDSA